MLAEYLASIADEYEVSFSYNPEFRDLYVKLTKDGAWDCDVIAYERLSDEEYIIKIIETMISRLEYLLKGE